MANNLKLESLSKEEINRKYDESQLASNLSDYDMVTDLNVRPNHAGVVTLRKRTEIYKDKNTGEVILSRHQFTKGNGEQSDWIVTYLKYNGVNYTRKP